MAAADDSSASGEQQQSDIREYDPTLDFYSDQFDPLKALTTPGVVPPVVRATTYDNLSQYQRAHADQSRQQVPKAGSSKPAAAGLLERRWLPHQLPIRTQRPPSRNVITRMEAAAGPLGLLKKCKDERIRIKVWTRHSHNIRGYCIGFVTVFDKHWDLVLEDVTEVWTRPKPRKIPAGLDNIPKKNISNNRIVPPPVTIIKSDKKTETFERHVDQFLIRGEQIALIAVLTTYD